MRWSSASSTSQRLDLAVVEVARTIWDSLEVAPDVVLAFVTPHHRSAWQELPGLLSTQFPEAIRLGCSAGGVIGGGLEIEDGPGLALAAGALPGVTIRPFWLAGGEEPASPATEQQWSKRLQAEPGDAMHTILLPDPFSADVEQLIEGLDQTFPVGTVIGGLVSGARQRGQSMLLIEDRIEHEGTAGIGLSGNIEVESIVTQGCKPIGNPMFVTSCSGPLILELDGQMPAKVLQELYDELPAGDQELLRGSLFVGSVMYDDRIEYHRGDFLLRNIVGFDPGSGAIAVNFKMTKGQVIQFHVRDAKSSAEDLEELLISRQLSLRPAPAATLLFSCLGRGRDLYGHANHDSNAFLSHIGPVPLAGFFSNGEIGPVGGQTFLHGCTSAFALIRTSRTE